MIVSALKTDISSKCFPLLFVLGVVNKNFDFSSAISFSQIRVQSHLLQKTKFFQVRVVRVLLSLCELRVFLLPCTASCIHSPP